MHKILFYNKFVICVYMFRALLCSSSGGQNCTIQPLVSLHVQVAVPCTGWVLSQSVHRTATYRCDDTRCCIIKFWPPDDEHMCSKHVEAWNKLIIKFSASSWLILRLKKADSSRQIRVVPHYGGTGFESQWAYSLLLWHLSFSSASCSALLWLPSHPP